MAITAHCLIRNEENFIWYALQSVLPYVDKILVWDTGSTDKTVEIIKSINSPKIEFEEKGLVNEASHTALRNEMIGRTQTEWFMILDGDEVWPEDQIKGALHDATSLGQDKNCVLSPFIFCVGDMYHYSTWGKYQTSWGLRGHYTARFFRKISGLHWQGGYDHDTLLYDGGTAVITRENTLVSKNYFFHCGVLPRSSKDYETGLGHGRRSVSTFSLGLFGHGRKLPLNKTIPEVFLLNPPEPVKNIEPLGLIESIKNLFTEYFPSRL